MLEVNNTERFRLTKLDLGACLIILVSATLLVLPILIHGLPNGDDAQMHYRRTTDFIEALREGSLYPRWLPKSNFGQGSPVMLYYPPLPFYLSGAFSLFIRDPMKVLSVTCWLGMVLSGLSMYLFSRSVLPMSIALFTSLLYMAMPYHIFDLYYRSALSEYWSFAWLPLVFGATRRVLLERRWAAIAYLAVAYSLLLLTHVLISFLITLLLPIYVLTHTTEFRRWLRVAASLGIGVMISAVFIVPLLLERDYVRLDRSLRIPFKNFFLFENVAGAVQLHRFPTPAEHSTYFGNALDLVSVGLPLLLIVAAAVLLRGKQFLNTPVHRSLVRSLFVIALLSLLMTIRLSTPVWNAWSQLHYIQFPFRWLTITTPTAVMLSGIALFVAVRLGKFRVLYCVALAAAAVINIATSALGITQATYDRDVLEQGLGAAEVAEYRTVWLDRQKSLDETIKPAIIVTEGDADVSVIDDSGRWQTYTANARTPSILALRTYYFPGWIVRVDGRPIEATPNTFGNIQLAVGPGDHSISLTFEDTWPRTAGKIISVAAVFSFLIAIGYGVRKSRTASLTGSRRKDQNDAQ